MPVKLQQIFSIWQQWFFSLFLSFCCWLVNSFSPQGQKAAFLFCVSETEPTLPNKTGLSFPAFFLCVVILFIFLKNVTFPPSLLNYLCQYCNNERKATKLLSGGSNLRVPKYIKIVWPLVLFFFLLISNKCCFELSDSTFMSRACWTVTECRCYQTSEVFCPWKVDSKRMFSSIMIVKKRKIPAENTAPARGFLACVFDSFLFKD